MYCFQIGLSQNLIKNGSFEKWNIDKPEDIEIVAPSPDFHKGKIRLYPGYVDNPDFTSRFPDNGSLGNSYLGIGSNIGGSECIALKLKVTLTKNKYYVISFDVFKPDIYTQNIPSVYHYKPLKDLPVSYREFTFKLNESNKINANIQMKSWNSIKDTFISSGGENYILVFGNANSDFNITYYMLYDNFRVKPLHPKTLDVYFDNNSSILDNNAVLKLDSFCRHTSLDAETMITLEAYADGKGTEENNYDLSVNRAKEVVNYLHNKNPYLKISKNHFGETRSTDNKEDRSKRRVTLFIEEFEDTISNELIIPASIKEDITKMFEEDQRLRGLPPPFTEEQRRSIDTMTRQHKPVIDSILSNYPYIGLSHLGVEKMDYLGVLLLHQDEKLQEKHKEVIRQAVNSRECSRFLFPYLMDKIQLSKNNKQLFGTQYFYENDKVRFYDIIDEKNLEKRRKEYGLPPMEVYLKQITE